LFFANKVLTFSTRFVYNLPFYLHLPFYPQFFVDKIIISVDKVDSLFDFGSFKPFFVGIL